MRPSDHTPSGNQDVDCAQVHAAIREGRPLSAEALAHVGACDGCRVLSDDAGALGSALESVSPDTDGLDALFARVDGDLQAETGALASLRARATRTRLLLAVLGVVAIPLLVLAGSPRVDLGVYPSLRLLLDTLLFWVPLLATLWLALRPLHRPALPRGVESAWVGAGVLAMALVALLPAAHHDHAASLLGVGDDFVARARGCFVTGVLAGLPALVWVRVLLRRGGPWWLVTALVASVAAISGTLAVFLHCPLVGTEHLLAGHATVLVLYLFVAAVAAWVFTARA